MKKEFNLYNEEPNVNLLTLSSLHNGFDGGGKKEKTVGQALRNTFVIYENDCFSAYFRESDVKAFGEKILALIGKNPKFFEKTLKPLEKSFKDAQKLYKQISRVSLKKKTDSELIKLLTKCYKITVEMCDMGAIPVLSDLEGFLLSNKMAKVVARKSKKERKDYLSILGAPVKLSPVQKIKFKLQSIKAKKRLRKEIKKILSQRPWFDYGYQGPIAEVVDLYDMFTEKKVNFQDPKKIKQLQTKYKKELGLSREEWAYFENAQSFGYQKALRVDARNMMFYCMDLILKILSRRTFYALSQLRYALPGELRDMVKKKGLKRHELDERRKFSLVKINSKREPDVLIGNKARKYMRERIKRVYINKRLKKFEGMVAQPGQAQGVVKVINNVSDIDKMNEGDILVAYATTPDVVPAMKKASAIVTESGGITCHAAIVSREMGIPCVVGVKHVVKIMKDGDRVEVDATKGIVRKL